MTVDIHEIMGIETAIPSNIVGTENIELVQGMGHYRMVQKDKKRLFFRYDQMIVF